MTKESREFQARLLNWNEIHELPGVWTPARLLSLLAGMEVSGVSENDALEMTIMALQDRDPDEAADRVLEAVFGETMRRGVRQNLAHDLTDDRPWEDFADIPHQMGIFNAVVLLQKALPRDFDRPDAVSVTIHLDTGSERGRKWIGASRPDPALLLRILAAGMDDSAILNRLFGEALEGTSFPEADGILWHIARTTEAAHAREFLLISSHEWFEPLKDLRDWTAAAWPDEPTDTGDSTER